MQKAVLYPSALELPQLPFWERGSPPGLLWRCGLLGRSNCQGFPCWGGARGKSPDHAFGAPGLSLLSSPLIRIRWEAGQPWIMQEGAQGLLPGHMVPKDQSLWTRNIGPGGLGMREQSK